MAESDEKQVVETADGTGDLASIMQGEAGTDGDVEFDLGDGDTPDTGADTGDAGEPADTGSSPVDESKAEAPGEDADPRDTAVKQLQELNEAYSSDPVSFIKNLMAGLTPNEQAILIGGQEAPAQLGQEASDLEDGYEPQSRFEEVYAPVLKSLPTRISTQVQKEVSDGISSMVPYVDHANITAAVVSAQINALAELLGVTMPDVPFAEITKAANTGKTTYAEAVNKVIGDKLKSAISNAKQARAPRPTAPSGTNQLGNLQRNSKGNVPLEEIMRRVGG